MGIELPDGIDDPESERSQRRHARNAAIARGQRSYQDATDAFIIAVSLNTFVAPIADLYAWMKLHEVLHQPDIATGLSIGCILLIHSAATVLPGLINYLEE